MIKIALKHDETINNQMPIKEEPNLASYIFLDSLEDIDQEEWDFLFIPKDDDLLASIDPSLYKQVILVDRTFTAAEMRQYFRLGVYDCLQLPISWEAYIKELTSIARDNKRKSRQEKHRRKYATEDRKSTRLNSSH